MLAEKKQALDPLEAPTDPSQPWASWGLVVDPKILDSLFRKVQTRDVKDHPCRHQQFAPLRGLAGVPLPAHGRCRHCTPSPGPGPNDCLEMAGFAYKAKRGGGCGGSGCREVLDFRAPEPGSHAKEPRTTRGRTVHVLVLRALAPCPTPSHAFCATNTITLPGAACAQPPCATSPHPSAPPQAQPHCPSPPHLSPAHPR